MRVHTHMHACTHTSIQAHLIRNSPHTNELLRAHGLWPKFSVHNLAWRKSRLTAQRPSVIPPYPCRCPLFPTTRWQSWPGTKSTTKCTLELEGKQHHWRHACGSAVVCTAHECTGSKQLPDLFVSWTFPPVALAAFSLSTSTVRAAFSSLWTSPMCARRVAKSEAAVPSPPPFSTDRTNVCWLPSAWFNVILMLDMLKETDAPSNLPTMELEFGNQHSVQIRVDDRKFW